MNQKSETVSLVQAAADEKAALRKTAKAARNALAEAERQSKSERICLRLSEIYDELAARRGRPSPAVCVYRAFGSEADVEGFAQHVWDRGGTVAFPCMRTREEEGSAADKPIGNRFDARTAGQADRRALMEMRLVSREAYLAHLEGGTKAVPFLRAAMKTFSPDDERLARFPVIAPDAADMVVVPLVAFDDEGGRLGYGGGHYDEFLRRTKPGAAIVGVGFAEQRIARVPREPHDIEIPLIVSA